MSLSAREVSLSGHEVSLSAGEVSLSGRGVSLSTRGTSLSRHRDGFELVQPPLREVGEPPYSHPFSRAIRAASIRFSAPSLLIASER